jgi:hypothetical protein
VRARSVLPDCDSTKMSCQPGSEARENSLLLVSLRISSAGESLAIGHRRTLPDLKVIPPQHLLLQNQGVDSSTRPDAIP